MKIERKLVSLLSAGLFFISCEKVIDVPLDEADRRFVIEAVLKDKTGDNSVKISKTGSVYQESDFEKISGATVKITNKAGTEFVFTEISGQPGTYSNSLFQVMTNDQYSLSITTADQNFNAVAKTFYKPEIDSLSITEQIGSFGIGTDTTYLVFFSFFDDGSATNFYRVNAYINGVKESAYYIINDKLFDGQTYTQPLFASTVEKGDTVLVEILSMDEGAYNYFFSLTSANTDGPFAPTPSNPVSNIDGNSLGYFGAYTSDTMSVIIPL